MARDNVGTTIERIRRQLASSQRHEVNVLGVLAPASTSSTVLTMTYDLAPSLRSGAVLSIGRELMRVITVDGPAKEVTVLRAWQDSELEAHQIGSEVLISPRFTRLDIADALVDEIESWAPDLFYVQDVQISITDDTEVIELPVEVADALGVIYVHYNATHKDTQAWPRTAFVLQRGAPSVWDATSTSGLLIRFTNPTGRLNAGKVLVTLARPFDASAITEATDLIGDLNLSASMLDLLHLGVKQRLMLDDEHGRSGRNTQDEPRRAEENPPGEALQTAQALLQRYERRRALEVGRLRQKYPMMSWT